MSWLQPKLSLKVAQKQILTPGLVQMVSVLALNRLELREMINQEMIANPVLEELSEHLTWQLSVTICSDTVREIAESIIGNLDEDGYLTASLEELAQNGRYTTDDLEDAVAVVQEFDPLGVAARDLRECLLIQLRTLD